jgi:hypothetical protein
MTSGNWLNNDGLYLQYGTQKAVQEMGGDYLMYGEWREVEVLISAGAASFGSPSGSNNLSALPSSFQGTVASQTAAANTGIVSYTTFMSLQPTAPVTVANTSGVLTITNPQLWIGQIDFETMVAWAAGGGSGTGLTGIGLVTALPVNGTNPAAWAQITPNAGVQLLGATTNAKMALGMHYTFYADGSIFGTGGVTTGSQPTAGSWLGNVPLTTLSETFLPGSLPNNAYISAIVSGGQFTQSGAGGLSSLRVRYRQQYTINDATQI